MDGGDWASIAAAIVAALSAWAVARSGSKANEANKRLEAEAMLAAKKLEQDSEKESVRSQAETDAYERARAFDTETIERQHRKIESLEQALAERESELGQVRTDNGLLHADVRMVSQENRDLHAELTSCHRVIENLRNYIRHHPSPVRGNLPPELELGPERIVGVNPEIRDAVAEVVNDDYAEPGDSYPDQD